MEIALISESSSDQPKHLLNVNLANDIGHFFIQKIERIWNEFDATSPNSRTDSATEFGKKSCSLNPMPTPLVPECLDFLLSV